MPTVTHRNIIGAEPIDLVGYLFRDERPYIPHSAMTPALILRYYEELVKRVPVKNLAAKSDNCTSGLESLISLLRHEPNPVYLQFGDWALREATKETVAQALPAGTPYQMQYLPLCHFGWPQWVHAPKEADGDMSILAPVTSEALLVSRHQKLYFAEATWTPKGSTYWFAQPPREIHSFMLTALSVEQITWEDPRLLERIESGIWASFTSVAATVQQALVCTAHLLESRARWLRTIDADITFAQESIYHGR